MPTFLQPAFYYSSTPRAYLDDRGMPLKNSSAITRHMEKEAIFLTLDPHSSFTEQDAYKNLYLSVK